MSSQNGYGVNFYDFYNLSVLLQSAVSALQTTLTQFAYNSTSNTTTILRNLSLATTTADTIQCNTYLTMPTSPLSVPGSNEIGNLLTAGSSSSSASIVNSIHLINSLTIPVGTYLITYNALITCTTAGTMNGIQLGLSTSNSTFANSYGQASLPSPPASAVGSLLTLDGQYLISQTTSSSLYFLYNLNTSGATTGAYTITPNISMLKIA